MFKKGIHRKMNTTKEFSTKQSESARSQSNSALEKTNEITKTELLEAQKTILGECKLTDKLYA